MDGELVHLLLESGQLVLQDLHGRHDDLIRRKSSSRFHSEHEFEVFLTDSDSLFDSLVLRELDAFLAEAAVVRILDVNDFSLVVETKYFSWTLFDKLSSLFLSHLLVQFFLVEFDNGLLPHGAS